jgi:hypothetical protein
MLDIIALVFIGLAGLGSVHVIQVILLTLAFIVDWFVDRAAQVRTDKNKLAVSVAEDIKAGNVSYIQGIFDTDKEKFVEARRVKASAVEDDVRAAHADRRVAVWT